MVNSEAVLKRWKEYFEKLVNEENNRKPRTDEVEVVNEEVNCVNREVKNVLKRMKKGKAVGPDELPIEVWKCMGEMGIKFLTKLFNRLLMGERMSEEWRGSVLSPIYKNKGDAQRCENYREMKLMSHAKNIFFSFQPFPSVRGGHSVSSFSTSFCLQHPSPLHQLPAYLPLLHLKIFSLVSLFSSFPVTPFPSFFFLHTLGLSS